MTIGGVDAASWIVAGGTLALAVATLVLAWWTRKAVDVGNRTADAAERSVAQTAALIAAAEAQATASEDLAVTTRQSLEASREPNLLPAAKSETYDRNPMPTFAAEGISTPSVQDFPVAKAWHVPPGSAWLALKIRNEGKGPAVIPAAPDAIVLGTAGPQPIRLEPGGITARTIAPGDQATLVFSTDRMTPAMVSTFYSWISIGNAFKLTIRYGDVDGLNAFESVYEVGTQRPDPDVRLLHRTRLA